MRKHYRITNPLRFFAFVMLITLLLTFACISLFRIDQASAASVDTYKQIEIQESGTLWNIAETYCSNDMDIRDYVEDICEVNDISADDVKPGDIVFVPIYDM